MSLTLLVLAAGMGSRYGGLKQIDPVGPGGETLLDYSVYDAVRAGFDRVVFIVRGDMESDFRSAAGRKIEQQVPVEYCRQELEMVPGWFSIPPERRKPWGTGHAVLAARDAIDGNFAAVNADVLITSGGVSVGEADYVKEILAKLGRVDFWKVAIKPGRPLAFGQVGNAVFFGLPGNPVSVMVTFYEFVQPALRKMIGEDDTGILTLKARCDSRLKKRPGRVEYQRGILRRDEDGSLVVVKTGAQGSGILSSMSQANCFIILTIDSSGVEPGMYVDIQPFSGLV